jgi:hypothetical protein
MKHKTILFISNDKISSSSVLTAMKATGHRVLSTTSTQAPALLYILRCFAAVVLDHCGSEEVSFNLARNLRKICQYVPIILLSPIPINPLPSYVDASISTGVPPTNLTSAVLQVLAKLGDGPWRDSLRQAS